MREFFNLSNAPADDEVSIGSSRVGLDEILLRGAYGLNVNPHLSVDVIAYLIIAANRQNYYLVGKSERSSTMKFYTGIPSSLEKLENWSR